MPRGKKQLDYHCDFFYIKTMNRTYYEQRRWNRKMIKIAQ